MRAYPFSSQTHVFLIYAADLMVYNKDPQKLQDILIFHPFIFFFNHVDILLTFYL